VKSGESVVLVLTGHLLKDPEFTLKFHRGELFKDGAPGTLASHRRSPIVLDATAEAVLRALEQAEKGSAQPYNASPKEAVSATVFCARAAPAGQLCQPRVTLR